MNKFTVLLIDDMQENLHSLKLILDDNFENELIIHEAQNVHDALLLIMTYNIDLILCDIQMPDMDGFKFIEYLHGMNETKDIPVMFITGIYASDECVKKGYDLGAIDYISKPIDDEILSSKLKVYMNLYEKLKEDKEIISEKDKLLAEQIKITSMINNLQEFSEELYRNISNSKDYKSLLSDEDNMIDIDSAIKKQ